MEKRKKIMLLPPTALPIPAVGGGAIEQLITQLLEENEVQQKVEFVVVSKYHPKAAVRQYKHSKVYYVKDEETPINVFPKLKQEHKLYLLGRKLFKNHITIKLFPPDIHYMDTFMYQCYRIALKEKVDYVVNEGRWNSDVFDIFNYKLGRDRLFYHVHYTRQEDISTRKVISNSISISNHVRKNWAVSDDIKGNNVVLYNGIDIKPFKKSYNRQTIRSQLNLDLTDTVAIFCGRIIPEKGVEQLLNAFEKLEKNYCNIKLILIGSVGFSDGTVTEFSERMVAKANRLTNVMYLGYIPNVDMPKYYAAADMQIIPSVWEEGAGLVAVEGMASGLPLIVTKSGGMVEYVNEDCAIQLPIDENLPDNIAETVVDLAANKECCCKMGKAGLNRAELFTQRKYYDNFIEIFQ